MRGHLARLFRAGAATEKVGDLVTFRLAYPLTAYSHDEMLLLLVGVCHRHAVARLSYCETVRHLGECAE